MMQTIINILQQNGYQLYSRPFELNIVGMRSRDATPNVFNDTIHVFYKTTKELWIHNRFAATTDPGTYWLQTLMNPAGTAILKPGQYIHSHRIGVHRNKYQALVQQNPVTVWRDANRNTIPDFNTTKEQTGIFGINIHRAAMKGKTMYVDKHSAGCQVLADVKDFDLLMQLAQRHKRLYGNQFTYTLIAEDEN